MIVSKIVAVEVMEAVMVESEAVGITGVTKIDLVMTVREAVAGGEMPLSQSVLPALFTVK